MKKKTFICIAVLLCFALQVFSPIVSAALPNPSTYFTISIKCSNSSVLSAIAIDVYSASLNTSESATTFSKYDETYEDTEYTNSSGNAVFVRPSDSFSFTVQLSSLPTGYGISEDTKFIFNGQNRYTLELSPISSLTFIEDETGVHPVLYDESSNRLCAEIETNEFSEIISDTANNENEQAENAVNELTIRKHIEATVYDNTYTYTNDTVYTYSNEIERAEHLYENGLMSDEDYNSLVFAYIADNDPHYKTDEEPTRYNDTYSVLSQDGHFRVYYEDLVNLPAYNNYNLEGLSGIIAANFESIYESFIEDFEFLKPYTTTLNGAYRIVLTTDVSGYLACAVRNSTLPNDTSSYIRVHPSVALAIYNSGNSTPEIGLLAKEYMEAIMYRYHLYYSYSEDSTYWMHLSFSTWAGLLFQPDYINLVDSNSNEIIVGYINNYLTTTHSYPLPTYYNSLGRSEGTSLFPMYIAAACDISMIESALATYSDWFMAQNYGISYTAFNALHYAITSENYDFDTLFANFAALNYDVLNCYELQYNLSNSTYLLPNYNESYSSANAYGFSETKNNNVPLSSMFIKFTPPANTVSRMTLTVTQTASTGSLQLRTVTSSVSGNDTINSLSITSGRMTVVTNDFSSGGTNKVILMAANAHRTQTTSFDYCASMNSYMPADNTHYSLKNAGSGLFLGMYEGNNVFQYGQSFYADQDFVLQSLNGYTNSYSLSMATMNSKYIDVHKSGGTPYNGANVFMSSIRLPQKQFWTFTLDTASGYYVITPYGSPTLDLTANGDLAGSDSGTLPTSPGNIFVSTYTGSDYQLWELVPASYA